MPMILQGIFGMKIILVIIIIFAIIFIAIYLYIWASGFITGGKDSPEIEAVCERFGEDYVVKIVSTNVPVPPQVFKYYLIDNNTGNSVEDLCNYSGLDNDSLCEGNADWTYGITYNFQDEYGNPVGNISLNDINT